MNGVLYDFFLCPFEQAGLGQLRHELLSHAHGKVLEIGSGTGLNFSYYPPDTEVIGLEPDEKMRERSHKKARAFSARVIAGDAMSLAFQNEEFDTVVGTLVFCTIPNPRLAMGEVYRVLKPKGHFLLLEHVKKNTLLIGTAQDLLTPLWKCATDGCHLNRDPSELIKEVGFIIEEYRPLWAGFGKYWVLSKPAG